MDDHDRPIELPILKRAPTERDQSRRDPRFDPKCSGSYDAKHFVRNYSFIESIREQEMKELQKALKREKVPEKKVQLQATLSRLRNKIQQQKELRVNPKQSKKDALVSKYQDLKKTGKFTKYIERKRKKLIKRDDFSR